MTSLTTNVIPSQSQAPLKIHRGCGLRIAGGIYATATGEITYQNIPIHQFLQCPPMPVNPADIGLAAQGILVKEGTAYNRPGLWDIFDWIGASHYPYVPDFIEEGKRYGFSRRIPESAPIHLLNTDSLHIMGHPRAILSNPHAFYKGRLGHEACPKDIEQHNLSDLNQDSCIALLYEAIGDLPEDIADPRDHTRFFPLDPTKNQFDYQVGYPIEKPEWQFGIFMTMRISALEVIEDPFSDKDQAAMDLLEQSGTNIPYYLMEA